MIKKVLLFPFLLISSLAQRVLAVMGAVIFAQFPAFLTCYLQRLGGHVSELAIIIEKYRIAAQKTGKSIEEYINLHLSSSIPDFVETGKIMSSNVERYDHLNQALLAIQKSDIWFRPMEFLKHFNRELFSETCKDYVLSINLSMEAMIYALMGIVLTMIILALLKTFFLFLFKKIFGKKHEKAGELYL